MRRARLIREGMSWRAACLEAGYSLSVANKGPRGYAHGGRNEMRTRRPGILKDFERAAEETVWKPETLKKIVIHRLATSVVEGRSSDVVREAELLGKLKEHDWFIRSGETNVGIFATLIETPPETDDPNKYRE